MKILSADYILTMDEAKPILKFGAVAFEDKVVKTSESVSELKELYPDASFEYLGRNSVLMPSLINSHLHLEFIQNKTTLKYGHFMNWLYSVFEKRDALLDGDLTVLIEQALKEMLSFGVGAVGAVSSAGLDMKALSSAKQKVVYFNEVLGADENRLDANKNGFIERFEKSLAMQNRRFTPAVSIHSPYAVHPSLLDYAIESAKLKNCTVATHFMESKSERVWVDKGRGEFKIFFKEMFGRSAPFISAEEFLRKFIGVRTVFVHCCYATEPELESIKSMDGAVVHCPISNRLLGSKLMDAETLKNLDIDFLVATDGLSSNFSLNLWNELRYALFMHDDLSLKILSQDLLKGVTVNAAKALNLNSGSFLEGKDADMIAFCLPDGGVDEEDLALTVLLHTNSVDRLYIQGENIL